MTEVRISSTPVASVSVYKLLQPILQDEPAEIKDRVTISPQSVARRFPTALDSLIHFPQRLATALSVAGTVVSWLAGPLGIVLGGIGVAAIPTGIVAYKKRQANCPNLEPPVGPEALPSGEK